MREWGYCKDCLYCPVVGKYKTCQHTGTVDYGIYLHSPDNMRCIDFVSRDSQYKDRLERLNDSISEFKSKWNITRRR